MTIAIKDGSTWRYPRSVEVNDGGTWRTVKSIAINDNSTWRIVAIHIASLTVGNASTSYGYLKSSFGSLSPSSDANAHEITRLEFDGGVTYIRYAGADGEFSGFTKTNYAKIFTVDGVSVNTVDAWDYQVTGTFLVEWRYLGDVFSLQSKNGTTISFQTTPA
jgi:hypothetical protein